MTSRSSVWDFLVYSLSFNYCWQHKFKLRLCDNRPMVIISQGILSYPHPKQTQTGFLVSCITEQVPPFLTLLLQIQCSALKASALSRGSSVTDLCRPKAQDFCFYSCQNPSSLVPRSGNHLHCFPARSTHNISSYFGFSSLFCESLFS